MNKKIRSFIFIILCCIHFHSKANEFASSASLLLLQDLPHLIAEHPALSLVIAALISLLSYKKLFFSDSNRKLNNNNVPKAEIIYPHSTGQATLLFTPPNKSEPYCYNNLHYYEISPRGSYLLMRQLQETSVVSAASKTILNRLDIVTTIQTLLRSSALYHIVDTATGNILLSLTNIQQCTFSSNEKYLLVREIKPMGIIAKLFGRYQNKDLQQKQKDTSCIQYRIIDLATKKTIATFNDILSATFINEDDLKIIHPDESIHYYSPQTRISMNPFTHKIEYTENKDLSNLSNYTPSVIFYFDTIYQTYCIDICLTKTVTIKHIKTYQLYENYLLINTDEVEHQQLEALPSEVTMVSLLDTIYRMISIFKKPQFVAQLINLTTGLSISDTFKYTNPVICSFTHDDITDHQTVFIAEKIANKKRPTYKQFDLETHEEELYRNGAAITFYANNIYTVIDKKNTLCSAEKGNMQGNVLGKFNEKAKPITKKAEETIEKFTEDAKKFLAQIFNTPQEETTTTTSCQQSTYLATAQTLYQNYPFLCQKLNFDPSKKTNYQELLQTGTHGFVWNIYLFTPDKFNHFWTNNLDGYLPHERSGHICISNLEPKKMKYTQYQSLTKELSNVIEYMKKNTAAVISISVIANDCPAEKIDEEIIAVLQKQDYNPLLKSTELQEQQDLSQLTIGKMIHDNKRLLFFCDKLKTSITFPLSSASKCITYN